MMGNAVQCDVWCESQYDGEVTSCGSQTKDHEQDSWHLCTTKMYFFIYFLLDVLNVQRTFRNNVFY